MPSTRRRELLKGISGGALTALLPSAHAQTAGGEYSLFWGDLHNHNSVGYARGSLERTYEIAKEHLDFLAFTPHAQWHDMPVMPNDAHMKWVKGFEVLQQKWPQVQKMAAESNKPGKFVSILAYEWHSSKFGDYCLYYPGDGMPLRYFEHVRDLQKHVRGSGAMIVPHHLAYKQGWRGANWEYVDVSVSPVFEIFSEHGLSERDNAAEPYIRHSIGGRWTRNTLQAALKRGLKAGVIASSDDHLGYPGAYGEGLAGVFARGLTREDVFEALWKRRTVAVTGDRIHLVAKLNNQWMGSTLPFAADREIQVDATGQDEIERIDVLKNNRVLARYFPEDHLRENAPWPGEALCRLEFGWGPWADLNMARVAEWDVTVSINNGKLLGVTPCFQSGPFEEALRDRIVERTGASCRFQLFTSRRQAFKEIATKSVVLRIAGGRSASIEVKVAKPATVAVKRTLGELAENNEVEFTGPFTAESFVVHRLVTPQQYRASFRYTDRGRRGQTDWYYTRVTQMNGHQAWSSPIWVEG